MRLFEIVLSVANLLALLGLAIPRLRANRWVNLTGPFAGLMAIVQIVVEGWRWEMIPAYTLAGIFLVVWLIRSVVKAKLRLGRAGKIASTGAAILVMVISMVLPLILPVFKFPKPTGSYAIGELTYYWTDSSRPELFTLDPNDKRQLMAQVWYPAVDEPSAPRAPYIPDASNVTAAISKLLNMPPFLFDQLKYVTTNAVEGAPISSNQSSYPVLIYLTGVDGFSSVSTFQIQELVSQGYIVVGLDQPGIAPLIRFPNGQQIYGYSREQLQPQIDQSANPQSPAPILNGIPLPDGIVPYFAQDASFALDQLAIINGSDPNRILTGKMDFARVGTFGISLGGMDAAEFALTDPRVKACIIMDVNLPADVVNRGLRQPTMFLTRDLATFELEHATNGTFTGNSIQETIDTMHSVYERLPGDGYYVEIKGMFHVNFTDIPYWSPLMKSLGETGPINPQTGFNIVNAYSVAFFDKELRGGAPALLASLSSPYPEVIFQKNK